MGKGRGRLEEKAQGIRSINGRHKIDRRRLWIMWEMEKAENPYTTHGHELKGRGNAGGKGGAGWRE